MEVRDAGDVAGAVDGERGVPAGVWTPAIAVAGWTTRFPLLALTAPAPAANARSNGCGVTRSLHGMESHAFSITPHTFRFRSPWRFAFLRAYVDKRFQASDYRSSSSPYIYRSNTFSGISVSSTCTEVQNLSCICRSTGRLSVVIKVPSSHSDSNFDRDDNA